MKHLLSKSYLGQVLGLTVTLLPEGKRRLAGCLLRKKADTISVEKLWPELRDLEHLHEVFPEVEVPLVLVVEGRGVLHKEFDAPLPPTDAEAIALVLPGATASDFYLQRDSGNHSHYATIIRRATIENLLADFRNQGRYIIAFEAGPFSLPALVPFLDKEWLNITAQSGHYALTLQEGKIAHLAVTDPNESGTAIYQLGGQDLTPQTLPAYAAGIRSLLGYEPSALAAEVIEKERKEWQQKMLFRQRGIALLGFFLVVLLANFWVFTQLSSKNQVLTTRMAYSQQELKTLTALRQTVQQQRQFLQSAGWLTPTSQSVYADKLAASIPGGVQLTQLDINPVDETATRQGQEVIFIQNTITVKGKCREAQTLNDWLQVLNSLPWVKQIQQQKFTYDYGTGAGTFSFTVKLPSKP